jgi:hypothetical protein
MKHNGSSRATALLSIGFLIFGFIICVTGCSRRQVSGRMEQAQIVTQETLYNVLLGEDLSRPGPIRDTRYSDKPLLEKGVYENVVLLADTEGFVKISRGSVDKGEVEAVQKNIIGALKKPLQKRGFAFVTDPNTPRTLKVFLSPILQESVSKQPNKAPLILVKMTISDPQTNTILTERTYYSGQDVKVEERR